MITANTEVGGSPPSGSQRPKPPASVGSVGAVGARLFVPVIVAGGNSLWMVKLASNARIAPTPRESIGRLVSGQCFLRFEQLAGQAGRLGDACRRRGAERDREGETYQSVA